MKLYDDEWVKYSYGIYTKYENQFTHKRNNSYFTLNTLINIFQILSLLIL